VKQSHFRYLGVLDLLLVAGFGGVFGPAQLVASPIVLMGIAGVSAVFAGSISALSLGPITVSWRHLVGFSYVTFALMWPAIFAPDIVAGTASRQDLLLFVLTTIGALSLAVYGIDVARGGRYFTIQRDIERVIEL
jgi:hypothetical protein